MARADKDDALTTQLTDAHLAQQARTGDSSSFMELYRRHAATSARFAAVVAGGSDVVAQVVTKAFAQSLSDPFELESGLGRPYLPDLLRAVREAALKASGPDDFNARQIAHVVPNDSQFELVLHAFGRLPEPQRSAVWLTSVAGLSAPEAGTALDVSEDEVLRLVDLAGDRLGGRQQAAITALHGLRMPLPGNHLAATLAAHGYRSRPYQGASLLEKRPRVAGRLPIEDWLRPFTGNPARTGALALLVILVVGVLLIENRGDTAGSFRFGDDESPVSGPQRSPATTNRPLRRTPGGSASAAAGRSQSPANSTRSVGTTSTGPVARRSTTVTRNFSAATLGSTPTTAVAELGPVVAALPSTSEGSGRPSGPTSTAPFAFTLPSTPAPSNPPPTTSRPPPPPPPPPPPTTRPPSVPPTTAPPTTRPPTTLPPPTTVPPTTLPPPTTVPPTTTTLPPPTVPPTTLPTTTSSTTLPIGGLPLP